MAYVRNILFFGCKYFRSNKKGIFSLDYETRKLFSVTPNLESRFCVNVIFHSSIVIPSRRLSSGKFRYAEKRPKFSIQTVKMLNKFKHLKLENLTEHPNKFHGTALLALFHKMCVVYHLNKFDTKFIINLPHILETDEFKTFCTLLEQKLPRLTPDVFVLLLNLSLFKVPVDCILMRKIFTLILDNFNCLSMHDILELYIQLSDSYFKNSEECKNIIKACEVYFEKSFEDEISHSVLCGDLVHWLSEKQLPINVRKIIAERLLELFSNNNFLPVLTKKFLRCLFELPFFPSLKDRTFKLLKDIVAINFSAKTLNMYCSEYQNAVINNNDYYDEEICEMFAESSLKFKNKFQDTIISMNQLCLMGYFHKNLFHYTLDVMLDLQSSRWKPEIAFNMASVLVQTNYHEMNDSNLKRIREILESFEAEKAFFNNFKNYLKWIEYLTFLGCDTRHLLTTVFRFVSQEKLLKQFKNVECRLVVELHHFAKEYFSDGYVRLSDGMIDSYLKKAAFPSIFYPPTHLLDFFGGEDYVIQNCTTSQKYFIPFTVILGPDNKPINLSSAKSAFGMTSEKNKHKDIVNINLRVEDIPRPPDSKVIIFIGYSDIQPIKFRNVPMTCGMARILMKSYQSLQYDTILMPLKLLNSKPEETVKYLQSQINEIIKKPHAQTIEN